jgi:membrane protein YqaA with SNARE-associated domain
MTGAGNGGDDAVLAQATPEGARPSPFARLGPFLRNNWRYVLSIGVSVVLTVVLLLLPIDYEALGSYGYLGVFLATLLPSATVVFPSPTIVAAVIAGSFLNPVLAGLTAGLGATIGELSGYLMGYGGSALAEQSPHYERVRRAVDRFGLLTIFVLAFIPNPLFDLAGIAAGTTRMPVWRFQLACFLGKSLRFILLSYAGWWWLTR